MRLHHDQKAMASQDLLSFAHQAQGKTTTTKRWIDPYPFDMGNRFAFLQDRSPPQSFAQERLFVGQNMECLHRMSASHVENIEIPFIVTLGKIADLHQIALQMGQSRVSSEMTRG